MATITKPMALDESFNTTESTPRNIADVLAEIGEAIAQGMGRQANEVSYDNTDSGLTADDVQDAIDEIVDDLDDKVDKVNGKGLSTNDYITADKEKLAGIEAGAEVNVQSDWAQDDNTKDDYIKNKQIITDAIESTQVSTGNPITLTDAAPINAESLVVVLEPIQEGSGDPSPTNVRPITGYTECEVDDVGKNRLAPTEYSGSYNPSVGSSLKTGTAKPFTIDSNGTLSVTVSTDWSGNLFATGVLQAGNYKFTAQTFSDGNIRASIAVTDEELNVKRLIANRTSSGKYNNLIVQVSDGERIAYITHASVAETFTITNFYLYAEDEFVEQYEPYHSSNATIQFGQTVYGGKSNFTDGGTDDEWDIITFTNEWSDEDVTQDGGHRYRYVGTVSGLVPLADIMCDCLKGVKKNANTIKMGEVSITGSPEYPFIRVVTNMDFNDFKTFIVGKQACYKVAPSIISTPPIELKLLKGTNNLTTNGTTINLGYQPDNVIGEVKGEIQAITEMDYLKILDNNVETPVNNYRIYYHFISSAYTLVNMAEMLQHRFIFVEVIQNPSGTSNHNLLHSALIDPRTIDGFTYSIKASGNDTIWIESILDENKFNLSLRTTGGSYSDGDPTDYYVTIRMVD